MATVGTATTSPPWGWPFAIDRSAVGIAAARSLASRSTGAADVHFLKADLTTVAPWRAVAAARDGVQSGRCAYYGRFLLHTMAPGRRHRVLAHLAHTMQPPDLALFEFRTPLDAALPKQRAHRRWYVDHADLALGVAGLGLHLDVDETGTGLAIFGNEDPHVARVTVTVAR